MLMFRINHLRRLLRQGKTVGLLFKDAEKASRVLDILQSNLLFSNCMFSGCLQLDYHDEQKRVVESKCVAIASINVAALWSSVNGTCKGILAESDSHTPEFREGVIDWCASLKKEIEEEYHIRCDTDISCTPDKIMEF